MVLSTAYLGNIHYFSKLIRGAAVEAHEHFQKQTFRNRAQIMTAQGVRELVVPVVWKHHAKMPIRTVRVDNSLPWQRNHWRSLRTAYASAPYFDHYAPRLEALYALPAELLFDWNAQLTQSLLEWMGFDTQPATTGQYQKELPPDEDFRTSITPRARLQRPDASFTAPRYYQVFEEQQPFAPNLSVIDLLFCEGPAAADHIRNAIRR